LIRLIAKELRPFFPGEVAGYTLAGQLQSKEPPVFAGGFLLNGWPTTTSIRCYPGCQAKLRRNLHPPSNLPIALPVGDFVDQLGIVGRGLDLAACVRGPGRDGVLAQRRVGPGEGPETPGTFALLAGGQLSLLPGTVIFY